MLTGMFSKCLTCKLTFVIVAVIHICLLRNSLKNIEYVRIISVAEHNSLALNKSRRLQKCIIIILCR